ncbi:MAG: hypothetical protein NZL85_02480, partial [Fimbriimonadales bacterium]|nr:hypothetical protein [Fimbriimonadales bacterium]
MQGEAQEFIRPFRVGIGQIKPFKGNYRRNLERIGALIGQIVQQELPVEVLALPETVTTGYFIEGGVRELAMPAARLLRDLAELYADYKPSRPLDICLGFYERYRGED